MQQTIKINTKKLSKQVADIDTLSKDNNWSYRYDRNLDTLYYSSTSAKDGYILFSVNDELSIYIDSDSNLGGIFIEYYQTNLASHDEKFIPFAKIFTKKINDV